MWIRFIKDLRRRSLLKTRGLRVVSGIFRKDLWLKLFTVPGENMLKAPCGILGGNSNY